MCDYGPRCPQCHKLDFLSNAHRKSFKYLTSYNNEMAPTQGKRGGQVKKGLQWKTGLVHFYDPFWIFVSCSVISLSKWTLNQKSLTQHASNYTAGVLDPLFTGNHWSMLPPPKKGPSILFILQMRTVIQKLQLSTVPFTPATTASFTAVMVFTGSLHHCLVQSHYMQCFHHCLIWI